MTDTFAASLQHLRTVIADQVDGYRQLLHSTREGNRALRGQDFETFDRVLNEQVETLRQLKGLQTERQRILREVGDGYLDESVQSLQSDLRGLAREVSRTTRVSRLVIERNGALVEARLGLHRRASGGEATVPRAGVDRFA